MVGTRPNRDEAHQERIRAWMNDIVKDGGIDRYDDLHVDRIDDEWKNPETWISASLEALQIAVQIHNENEVTRNFTVVVAFSLKSSERRNEISLTSVAELKNSFCATPPSLYLLRPGMEFWTQAAEHVKLESIDAKSLFGSERVVRECIYMEFKRRDTDDFTRSLFLVG